jgi:hypothetical protein
MELTKKRARIIYDVCCEHLIEEGAKQKISITHRLIKRYMENHGYRVHDLSDVLGALIWSIHSSSMIPSVIKLDDGLIKNVLFNFDPKKIRNAYGDSARKLTIAVKGYDASIKIDGVLWQRFCVGIIDSARWISQFKDFQAFLKYVKPFHKRGFEGLTMMAESLGDGRIKGFKIALAFNFIKELGLPISKDTAKPDTHTIQTMVSLGLSKRSDSENDIVLAISNLANRIGITTFAMDRLIWLSNSGNFFKEEYERLWTPAQTPHHRQQVVKEIKKRWKQK